MTLARFVIFNQKGGDCKGISPLMLFCLKMTLELECGLTLPTSVYTGFSPRGVMEDGVRPPIRFTNEKTVFCSFILLFI